MSVGPAWRVSDDPGDPEALFGGAFDDAMFPARRTDLADGRSMTAALPVEGRLVRGSYRDLPAPRPARVVVEESPAAPPAAFLLVNAFDLHPLGPERWMLDVDAAVVEGGRAGGRAGVRFLSTSPEALVRGCVAAVGPARESHAGVRTPALLFEGITF
jgi:hypothetical protein